MSEKGKKIKRLVIAICLVVFSIGAGVFAGIKIGIECASTTINTSYDSELGSVEKVLKEEWYSDIYYGKGIDEDVLIRQFCGAYSQSGNDVMLDGYTYLEKNEETSGVVTGKLGITLQNYGNYPIISFVEPTGASYGTLHIGDIVVAVTSPSNVTYKVSDGGTTFSTVFSQALGLPGESVKVEYYRYNSDNSRLERRFDYITLKQPSSYQTTAYYEECGIADTTFLTITRFNTGANGADTCSQVESVLKNHPAKNLIINLVDNGGGSLGSVVDICDLFLPNDKLVVSLENKNGIKTPYKTAKDQMYSYDKIIILQNSGTASASEILISTLTYYYPDIVTLVGSKSYGKGIASTSVTVLEGKYTLHYTAAKWLRPDDSWIGMTGSAYTDKEGYQLGFDVKTENQVEEDVILAYRIAYSNYLYYKQTNFQYDAFTIDVVSPINSAFFSLFNMVYNTTIREDGYFDNACLTTINNYQLSKGLEQTANMDEITYINFMFDLFSYNKNYVNNYLNEAFEVING